MKKQNLLLPFFIPFYTLLAILLFGNSPVVAQGAQGLLHNYEQGTTVAGYFKQNKQSLGLSAHSYMKRLKEVEGNSGWRHIKYQQYYKGLEVLDAVYILHEKEGTVQRANGFVQPGIDLDIHPAIEVESAWTSVALMDRVKAFADHNSSSVRPVPEEPEMADYALVIVDAAYPAYSGNSRLAWRIDLDYQPALLRKMRYIVDAKTGSVIHSSTLLESNNIDVEVMTTYSGRRSIVVDSIAPDFYELADYTRGGGVFVKDGFTDTTYRASSKSDWAIHGENYDIGIDVHFGAEAYYDMLKDKFGRNSIDDQGMPLVGVAHGGQYGPLVNAFWSGTFALFGDGDCTSFSPLTSLDVVGHEFTHGLTQKTADLNYFDESGGLNEAMSDIFGKMLEYYYDPAGFNWLIGNAFANDQEAFRSMKDPNRFENPKYYKGKYWGLEVHNSSGVLNYWYYLVCDGDKGENEVGYSFDVPGIGKDKAIQIVYLMLTSYLTPGSTYRDAAEASILATKELYGEQAEELSTIVEAWETVGLGPSPSLQGRNIGVVIADAILSAGTNVQVCESDSLQLQYYLFNNGTDAWPKEDSIVVNVELSGFDYEQEHVIHLDNDLEPGDSVLITLEEVYHFTNSTNPNAITAYCQVLNDPEEADNTSQLVYAIQSGLDAYDSYLFGFFSSRTQSCLNFAGDRLSYLTIFVISNNGCKTWLPGDTILIDVKTKYGVVSQTKTVNLPVRPEEVYYDFLFLSLGVDFGENQWEASVKLKDEERLSDNTTTFGSQGIEPVSIGYKQDFEAFDIESDTNKNIAPNSLLRYKVLDNNGNKMLAVGANFGRPPLNPDFDPCTDPRRFAEGNRLSNVLSFCVNLKPAIIAPVLTFDMAQYRREVPEVSVSPERTNIVKVSYFPNPKEIYDYYIYGAEEGEMKHYTVPLPPSYHGGVSIQAMFYSGEAKELVLSELKETDAFLIDNIAFEQSNAVDNPAKDRTALFVMPNPATDMVVFSSKQRGGTVEVYDISGHLITRLQGKEGHFSWNTSAVPRGMYFYHLVKDGVVLDVGKVVLL